MARPDSPVIAQHLQDEVVLAADIPAETSYTSPQQETNVDHTQILALLGQMKDQIEKMQGQIDEIQDLMERIQNEYPCLSPYYG